METYYLHPVAVAVPLRMNDGTVRTRYVVRFIAPRKASAWQALYARHSLRSRRSWRQR